MCACFLLGVLFSFYVNPPAFFWLFALPLAVISLFGGKAPRAASASLCILCCLLGLLRGAQDFHAVRFTPADKGVMTGTVKEVGYHEYSKSQLILSDVRFEGRLLETDAVITVYGSFDAKPADNIRCTVKLRPIENYPDATFDYKTWRLSQNIAYQATGSNAVMEGQNQSIRFWPERFSYKLTGVMTALYGDKAGMAIGMTLGDTQRMTDDELSVFRAAGIAHVLSVSGLNFAFFMVALQWLLGKRTYASTFRLVITLLLLWIYCAVVGFVASALRACLMLSLYLFASWAGWQYDLLTSICLAAAILAAIQPAQLFAAGFCLSFSATAGIALFYPTFTKNLNRLKFLPKRINQALSVWAAAQIGIMPFMIYFFRQVQLYGALGNLLAVPLSSIVTVGGLLSALLGLVLFPLGSVIAWGVRWVCIAIETIAKLCAALPGAQITLPSARFVFLAAWCLIALILSRYCLLKPKTKWIASGICALIAIVLPV